MVLTYLFPEDGSFYHKGGSYLAVDEIVRRLRGEFRFVEVDPVRGRNGIIQRIEYLRSLESQRKNPFGEPISDQIKHYTDVLDDVCYVRCSDDPETESAYISATLIPGHQIMFSYDGDDHYARAQPLVERFAEAIGYEIEEGG